MGEANDTANRMIKTGEGKAPTLTLDPDEVKYDMSFMEPSLKKNMPAEETKAAAAGRSMSRCCLRMRRGRWRRL